MSPVYTFDRTALLKILLHAAKYPAASVNGILLADTQKGKSKDQAVNVVDAIPVLHSFLTLAPVLETALIQIQSYAKQKGLQLIGYYHANERFDDIELGPSARKVADKLHANNQLSCAVLLDTPKLAAFLQGKGDEFLQLYTKESGRHWTKESGGLQFDSTDLRGVFVEMASQERHRKLSDFDDHLNDITRDWRNEELLS